jgi:ubiquinone/menaquinone biosynthesis C-methylase UbiE
MEKISLGNIYHRRWDRENKKSIPALNRARAWDVLTKKVFQGFVSETSTILDLGCGQGDFINRIKCARKIAVDLDSSNAKYLEPDVEFVNTSARELGQIQKASINVVFTSNMLEHLSSREELFETLFEIQRVLKSDSSGILLIMMPNINKVGMRFYDFIDHTLPLNDSSLREALELCGFKVERVIPGFFPYSAVNTRFTFPKFLYKLYLHLPMNNRPFAGQMLIRASLLS